MGYGTYFVVSGVSGQMIWGPYYPANPPAGITCATGNAAILGDFDGDGTTDIAISCGTGGSYSGHVAVVSGFDGHEIVRLTNPLPPLAGAYAWSVGAAGDVNGDGLGDFIVSNRLGGFDVHLGPAGAFAYSIFGPTHNTVAGRGVGDLNGDGKSEIVMGWAGTGVASVHSGADGALLTSFCMPHAGFARCGGRMGLQPVPMGDHNGDGIPDFALGNPYVGFGPSNASGFVTIFSGADCSVILQRWGRRTWGGLFPSEGLGKFLSGGTDINGDGVNDLVTSSERQGYTFFSVISGRTGQTLFRLRSAVYGGSYPIGTSAWGCAALGDLNGDGCAEWALCDPEYAAGGPLAGRMLVLKGAPGDVESICAGAHNSLGRASGLRLDGPPTWGTRELWIEIEDAIPDAIAQVVYGPEHPATPFGDGHLCIDPTFRFAYAAPIRLDATGAATVHADWARPSIATGPGAWSAGSTWVLQASYRDPGGPAGYNATEALRVTFNR